MIYTTILSPFSADDAAFIWRLLGQAKDKTPTFFGFSRTLSWGQDWARQECLRQPGDLVLANLDTNEEEVFRILENEFPNDTFWVDASREVPENACKFCCKFAICT